MKQKLNNILNHRRMRTVKLVVQILLFLFLAIISVLLGMRLKQMKNEEKRHDRIVHETKDMRETDGMATLHKKYDDMIGWVETDATDFSYPVMQTGIPTHHEDDWQYYLHKDVKGAYSFYGTPFMDVRCHSDSDNLIIYGHNINGRKYFGYLQNFRDETFFQKHKNFRFTKINEVEQTYQIVAVIETSKYASYYDFSDVGNDEDYKIAVANILNGSKFHNDTNERLKKEMYEETVEAFFHKYQFVSLSTCRTSEGHVKRLLVIGCKER